MQGDTNSSRDVFVYDRQTATTTRVSVASDGTQGNSGSEDVAFRAMAATSHSVLTHRTLPDTNDQKDVFVHDRQTGATTRVSVASDGTQSNSTSHQPSISADGRYVVFNSYASNLVSGDTTGATDVFVHDRQTGVTTRVSVASDGTEGNNASWAAAASTSADGRYIAFISDASNLVQGDTNRSRDVFVHDRQTATTTRVSVASDGTQGNTGGGDAAISGDGRYVTFGSSSNLVPGDTSPSDVFVHDRQTGTTGRVSIAPNGSEANHSSGGPAISADGQWITSSRRRRTWCPATQTAYPTRS